MGMVWQICNVVDQPLGWAELGGMHRELWIESTAPCACFQALPSQVVSIWNRLPHSVVDACAVNAFKAWLDKFWQHQAIKFDFTPNLTGNGNRSEEVIK